MRRILYAFLFFLLLSPALFGQEKATPLKGEGVHAFLKRNNRSDKAYYQAFIDLNRTRLGADNSLKMGVAYVLPPLSTSSPECSGGGAAIGQNRKEPLFGKKYEEYVVGSDRLKGACFYLVCGHGGPDPGAVGKINRHELHEDEYAYDITLRLARALLMEGAVVHIIIQDARDGIRDERYLANSNRETCMGSPIPLNQVARLRQRCEKINALAKKQPEKYQRSLFIHLDSRSQKQQVDVFFYYCKGSRGGQLLAENLRATFKEHYDKHQPNRGFTGTVSCRNLYVLRNSTPVAIFAELGNIQNAFDQRRFLVDDNRQALANWMCRGLIRDYEASRKR